ncbi:MAG: hypothetical protein GXP49_07865 [Deltaproteobacteria bacterium]|nr:hypothetical protein [Deltaproteobacteria bacterium]
MQPTDRRSPISTKANQNKFRQKRTGNPPASALAKQSRKNTDKEVIFKAAWGSGPEDVGHKLPENGAPEGPMSFFVAPDGGIFILDQVNKRMIHVKDHKADKTISIGSDTFQDIAVTSSGDIALLDRLAGKKVDVLEPDGNLVSSLPIEGKGVPEGGGVTGLFVKDNGIWVEDEHARLVRIADAHGVPDPNRPSILGRPSLDGSMNILARIEHPRGVVLQIRSTDNPGEESVASVTFASRISFLVELATDRIPRIFLAARLMDIDDAPPYRVRGVHNVVVVLDRTGKEITRLSLPAPGRDVDEEQFKSIRIGPDGSIYQLLFSSNGIVLTRWEIP